MGVGGRPYFYHQKLQSFQILLSTCFSLIKLLNLGTEQQEVFTKTSLHFSLNFSEDQTKV